MKREAILAFLRTAKRHACNEAWLAVLAFILEVEGHRCEHGYCSACGYYSRPRSSPELECRFVERLHAALNLSPAEPEVISPAPAKAEPETNELPQCRECSHLPEEAIHNIPWFVGFHTFRQVAAAPAKEPGA